MPPLMSSSALPPRLRRGPTPLDRMLAPVHRWIWRDRQRRVQKLLRFGETEIDGGRDLLRAALAAVPAAEMSL